MSKFRISLIVAAMALAGALAAPVALAAVSQTVSLPAGETHSGNYYAAANNITIDGTVNGDVLCAGQTVIINGAVHGDVLCAAQTITVNGSVDGSVRVAGQSVNLNGSIGRNATVAGQTVLFGNGAKTAMDVNVAGQTITLGAPIGNELYAAGQAVNINAAVAGTANLGVQDLVIGSGGAVDGNLNYWSQKSFSIDQAKVKGKVTFNQVSKKEMPKSSPIGAWLGTLVYWWLAGLLAAMAMILLLPRLAQSVSGTMLKRPGASVGWGFVALLAGPPVLLMLLLTIIGGPLAGLLGVLWVVAISTTGLFAGIATGRVVLRRDTKDRRDLAFAALAGVPLLVLVIWIPFLGFLVAVAATAWSLGGILLSLNSARELS